MKSLKYILVSLFVFSILVASFPLTNVSALSTTDIYTMPFERPYLDNDDVMLITHQQSGSNKYVHAYYLPVDVFVNSSTEPNNNNEHITNILYIYDSYFVHSAQSLQYTALYCNPTRYASTGTFNDLGLISGTTSFEKSYSFNGSLLGFQYLGDVDSVNYKGNTTYSSSTNDFVVLWGSEAVIYELIKDKFDIDNAELLAELISVVSSIDTSTDELESQLSYIFQRLGLTNETLETAKNYLSYIYTLCSDLRSNTDELETQLNSIKGKLDIIISNTDEIETKLDTISSKLTNIYTLLNLKLNEIIDILNASGSAAPDEDLDESIKDEHDQLENELLDKVDESDMENIDIQYNANALNVVFDIFNQTVLANQKVFTAFISVLSIGIIALVLGR